jgi:3-oxoacyl-[acyl-carrier-protein] synthase II
LVIGEGAGILVLEELDHAQPHAVPKSMLKSSATAPTATAATSPSRKKTPCSAAWKWHCAMPALRQTQVGYVNGHGTATEKGDIAETLATAAVFGHVPLSSQKSYFGHALGACGALESWFSIAMMNERLVCAHHQSR